MNIYDIKAYQVFKGTLNKHGHQQYDLIATYFDKEKALTHCQQIVEAIELNGDVVEEDFYGEGKFATWYKSNFWERNIIATFKEIDIIK